MDMAVEESPNDGEGAPSIPIPSASSPRPGRRGRWRRMLILAFALATLGVAAIVAFVGWVNRSMVRASTGLIHSRVEDVRPRQVALVLGALVHDDGRLSHMLDDRVLAGVDLYKSGKVRKLLMSGDNGREGYDEVTAMRRRAIELGVPSDDVVRDFAGFRTWDSVARAKAVWGLDSVTVVSQRFHLARSLAIARAFGLEAEGYVADRGTYARSLARANRREWLARPLAWLDIHVWRPAPRYLGPPETLSGDAQKGRLPGQ